MKWYWYIICVILVLLGVFCGIQLYKEVKAESYVNGSIDISNKFSQESFKYTNTSVVFYHDIYDETDTYIFEADCLKVDDFNGLTNTYQVVLNDYVLLGSEITAGSIFTNVNLDFYDTYGEIIKSVDMQISIKFLSDKTQLTLATTGNENASFLEQYFSNNGIRLYVNEIL